MSIIFQIPFLLPFSSGSKFIHFPVNHFHVNQFPGQVFTTFFQWLEIHSISSKSFSMSIIFQIEFLLPFSSGCKFIHFPVNHFPCQSISRSGFYYLFPVVENSFNFQYIIFHVNHFPNWIFTTFFQWWQIHSFSSKSFSMSTIFQIGIFMPFSSG